MVQTDQDIRQAVYAAQQDTEAADALIRQYLPFIRAETVRFTHEAIEHGQEDALSIAMFAFYESILRYQASRGAFLPFAARNIRNRLIDQARAERRHRGHLSLQTPVGEDAEGELGDTLADPEDAPAALEHRLASFGLQYSDVADNCPRQARTLAACRRVLAYARANPALLDKLEQTVRLPMQQLADATGVERKTLERHRKYLVAILLAFTNGYEIIRGHLCQLDRGERRGGQ